GEGAGLTQLGELDVTAPDHPADLGERHLLAQRLQIPARDAEEEGVIFAAGEGQVQPVAQTAGGGSQRERGAFDDGADRALVAQVPQVLEEAVADVDGGRGVTGGEKALADERLRTPLRAGGRRRGRDPKGSRRAPSNPRPRGKSAAARNARPRRRRRSSRRAAFPGQRTAPRSRCPGRSPPPGRAGTASGTPR